MSLINRDKDGEDIGIEEILSLVALTLFAMIYFGVLGDYKELLVIGAGIVVSIEIGMRIIRYLRKRRERMY